MLNKKHCIVARDSNRKENPWNSDSKEICEATMERIMISNEYVC